MAKPFISVYIPSYNHQKTISGTISSVLNQTFKNFDVVVRDDCSKDDTVKIAKKFKDKRLTIYKNKKNLGYSGNLNQGLIDTKSDIILILAGDDLIDKHALQWYHDAYIKNPKAGAVTRPYYWFDKNYKTAVRFKSTTKSKKDLAITIKSKFDDILLVLSSLDQCSGLSFKKSKTKQKFSDEIWVSHAYPWLDIFKNHPVVFLKKYPLAVYIGISATRTNIYQKSPMLYWKNLIDTIFIETKYKNLRQKILSDFISTNYIGLVQIKNYGSFKSYIREVFYLIKFRKTNLINIHFWAIFLFTLLIPPSILRVLTDKLKSILNKPFIDPSIIIDPTR
jgi:glycosyltransferase involved in cell wall biosynthesis